MVSITVVPATLFSRCTVSRVCGSVKLNVVTVNVFVCSHCACLYKIADVTFIFFKFYVLKRKSLHL
jgi:hypothetical protein